MLLSEPKHLARRNLLFLFPIVLEMADRVKQIKIKTGVVKRLTKEIDYYEKEAQKEEARHTKMEADGADEYQLRKQREVIQESKVMGPETKSRLKKAHEELQKMLEAEADLIETEEYKEAKNQLQEADKALTEKN